MSRSAEMRQFLLSHEGDGQSMRHGGVPTQRADRGETPRISDDQVRRARIAVAHSAQGEQDCARLLDMLGLVPDEDSHTPVQH